MDKMKFSYDYLYDWNIINEKKKRWIKNDYFISVIFI